MWRKNGLENKIMCFFGIQENKIVDSFCGYGYYKDIKKQKQTITNKNRGESDVTIT
jgi:hypothetical protein